MGDIATDVSGGRVFYWFAQRCGERPAWVLVRVYRGWWGGANPGVGDVLIPEMVGEE